MSSFEHRMTTAGERIVTAIFSYRATTTYSKQELNQDIIRKARYMFRRAGVAT